jgi:NADPH:quinone reductase-like Zn-dependent oxidoreductase
MKAYQIEKFGIENLGVSDVDLPSPAAGEVLVKLRAASLNYRDMMMIDGTYNPRLKLPLVPFSDGAGEVTAIGEAVTRWEVGDRVCPIFMLGWIDGELEHRKSKTTLGGDLDGCLREFGVFHEESLVRIPERLSYEEASCLPCAGVTAWNALMVSGNLKKGESVLIQGTGGVSMFALQFAKMLDCYAIVTSSSDDKLAKAKALGADETINYRQHEDWDKVVLELTNKRGVDHVVEVGGPGTLSRSMKAVKMAGHIAVIGVVAGAGEFTNVPIFMKALKMIGVFVGSRVMFEEMNAAIERTNTKPVIDRVFTFEKTREAIEYMRSANHFGKIVISIP